MSEGSKATVLQPLYLLNAKGFYQMATRVANTHPITTLIIGLGLLGTIALAITCAADSTVWDTIKTKVINPNKELLTGIGYAAIGYLCLRILGLAWIWIYSTSHNSSGIRSLHHRLKAGLQNCKAFWFHDPLLSLSNLRTSKCIKKDVGKILAMNKVSVIFISLVALGAIALFITSQGFKSDWESVKNFFSENKKIFEGVGYAIAGYAIIRIIGLAVALMRLQKTCQKENEGDAISRHTSSSHGEFGPLIDLGKNK